jgi:hypothetical protein
MADSITPDIHTDTREGAEELVRGMIDEAEAYIGRQVRQDRIEATDYYHGRPFGTEEEGRSQVILPIVRRVVRRIMPSLMRIFTGPERYVEFKPRGAATQELAKQQTDYVNYIVLEDNDGYSVLQAVFKDALSRRVGIVKWWSEVKAVPEAAEYTGLTELQLLSLFMDKDVRIENLQEEEPQTGVEQGATTTVAPDAEGNEEQAGPVTQPAASNAAGDSASPAPAPASLAAPKTYSATVIRGNTEMRIRIRECPGEEILWDRDARDIQSAKIIDHVRWDMPVHELLAMGYKLEDLEANIGMGPQNIAAATALQESDSRRNDQGLLRTELLGDPLTRPIRYDEAYVYLNYKNRGVRLYKVCTIGVSHVMLGEPEPVSHRPFALFTPDPEPHTFEGMSVYDDVGYLQKIESQIARGVLDSLSLTLSPAMAIVDGEVNVKDLLNPEIGRHIRVTAPEMIQPIEHRFAGADALSVLEYFDGEIENITGQSKASQGLDADVLQSTTKLAVASTMKAAQEQTEMIARNFAEGGLKQLYKGLLRTVIENQDQPRMVRLRGKYVEVDPRSWDANMDVIVNVGLGTGLTEDKLNALIQIAAKQEQIMATLGPNNPLVKLSQYRNTLARIIELTGFRNAAEFFSEIDPQQEAAAEAAAAQAPKTDPNAALAQAEVQKATIAAQSDEKRTAMEQTGKDKDRAVEAFRAQHAAELERMRLAAEIALKTHEIELKHGGAFDREAIKADTEKQKALLDAHTKVLVAGIHAHVAHEGNAAKVAAADIAADASTETAKHNAGAKIATAALSAASQPTDEVDTAIRKKEARSVGARVVEQANGSPGGSKPAA